MTKEEIQNKLKTVKNSIELIEEYISDATAMQSDLDDLTLEESKLELELDKMEEAELDAEEDMSDNDYKAEITKREYEDNFEKEPKFSMEFFNRTDASGSDADADMDDDSGGKESDSSEPAGYDSDRL